MISKSISRRGAILSGAVAAALGGVLTPVAALAQKKPTAGALSPEALTAAVEKLLGAKAEAFGPAPINGLFEVIVNGNVYYVDATGTHIIDGHIVDIGTRSSLTAKRKLEFERANSPVFDAASLNFDDAIKTVYGKPTPGRVLVTFEDPRCGFCKKLSQDLAGIKDLVVYTFPVSFLGPQSRDLNEAIWCAPDRSAAWKAAMAGQPVAGGTKCGDNAALDRNMDLARKFRVTGTPTMYSASGQRIVGAVGAAAIEEALRAAS